MSASPSPTEDCCDLDTGSRSRSPTDTKRLHPRLRIAATPTQCDAIAPTERLRATLSSRTRRPRPLSRIAVTPTVQPWGRKHCL